jgi:predicted transcriptional regulator
MITEIIIKNLKRFPCMSNSTSMTRPPETASNLPPASTTMPGPGFDPVALFTVLASPLRWQILQMLKSGETLSASEVAAALKRDFDGVSKHLRLMQKAGVLGLQFGADRRFTEYFIPAEFRREPGVLDFGVCRVRLA